MKSRILHIIILALMALPMLAQHDYRPFKVDAGLLLGEVHKHNVGLIAPYVEPKYNINNRFTVGMRLEYTFYYKEDFVDYNPDNPYFTDANAEGWNFSTILTGDYYFNDNYLRPFIGIGGGLYYMYIDTENSFDYSNKKNIGAMGFMPRAGFNIGQFRLSCEYNYIMTDEIDLNYFSLKIGYEIGGGKKWF